jgi:hypothetical protein
MKRYTLLFLFILISGSLFAEEPYNLFGIGKRAIVHIKTDSRWKLSCMTNNSEREIVLEGKGEILIPLEKLLIEQLDPSENHEFVLMLSTDSFTPNLELEITHGESKYIISAGYLVNDGFNNVLGLVYRYEKLK